MFTCPQCNSQVENGARFCAGCGASTSGNAGQLPVKVQQVVQARRADVEEPVETGQVLQAGGKHPAMNRSKRSGVLVPLLIAVAIGFPVLTIGGVVAALQSGWLRGKPNGNGVQVTPTQNAIVPKEELTESMKKELKKLEKDRDDLEKQIKDAKRQLDTHQEEIRKAETRIQNMLSVQQKLEKWQKASLVVGSEKLGAVAFTQGANKDELIYLDKADAELAAPAILASTRRGAQWFATNEQFVQSFESEFETGKPLRAENYQELAKRLVRTRVLAEPALTNAPYVSYRLKTDPKPKFARYCGKTESAIRVQHLGDREATVEASLVAPGSARLITKEEIKNLDDGEFLDAALLNAIARLQDSVASKRYTIPPKLAIDVKLTNGKLAKNGGGYVVGQLCRNSPGAADLDRAAYLLQADLYQRLVGIEKLDPGFSVAAPEKTGDFFSTAVVPKFVLGVVFAALRAPGAADALAVSGVKDWDKYDEEKAISAATHLLQVEVGPPAQGGAYFLNVQLHDLRDRTVLFADAGDRYYRARSNLHYPASGKLALMKRKSGLFDNDAVQEPEGLWRGTLFNANAKSANALVIGESLAAGTFNYRTLLGTQLKYELTKEIEVAPVTGDYEKKVPVADRVRLCAHQLIRSTLPPSSIVTSISETSGATINMGAKAKLKVGDRLAVARAMVLPNGESLVSELNVPVVVSEISESTAKVDFISTGLEELFPRNVLERGDTVYAQSPSMPVLVVAPFQFMGPANHEVAAKVRWDVPARRARLTAQANDGIKMLHARMGVALRSLSVPVIDYRQFDPRNPNDAVENIESYGKSPPPNARVTHFVNGEVKILTDDECQFEFIVTDPLSNELRERFPVTLKVGRD